MTELRVVAATSTILEIKAAIAAHSPVPDKSYPINSHITAIDKQGTASPQTAAAALLSIPAVAIAVKESQVREGGCCSIDRNNLGAVLPVKPTGVLTISLKSNSPCIAGNDDTLVKLYNPVQINRVIAKGSDRLTDSFPQT
ncbi:MAG TPA: hypothetical protein DCZ55_10320 [Cyanobacteria bacterium UBA11371]|nr:hypothetical protein [Cyanobacteria bacterium UBA11371]HBE33234.1 hypothetical protein [Cyanobacteria bacterium UBA11368]